MRGGALRRHEVPQPDRPKRHDELPDPACLFSFGTTCLCDVTRALDNQLAFLPEAERYYLAAFGNDGPLVLSYLRQLSTTFLPQYIRDRTGKEAVSPDHYSQIESIIADFQPVITRNLKSELPIGQRKSWAYLEPHAEVCAMLAKYAATRVADDSEGAAACWLNLESYLCGKELELQNVFDYFEFVYAYKRNGFAETSLRLA